MGNERFRIPELLFRPSDANVEQTGLAEVIALAIGKVAASAKDDIDRKTVIEKLMYSHIQIVGGSSLFPGLVDRLKRDLCSLAPDHVHVDIQVAAK